MVWCLMESSVKLGRPVGLLVAIRRLAGSYLVCLLVGHPVAIRSATDSSQSCPTAAASCPATSKTLCWWWTAKQRET